MKTQSRQIFKKKKQPTLSMTPQGPVLSPKVHSLCPKLCFHTGQKTHSKDENSSHKCPVVCFSPAPGAYGLWQVPTFPLSYLTFFLPPFSSHILPTTTKENHVEACTSTPPFSALPGFSQGHGPLSAVKAITGEVPTWPSAPGHRQL